MTGREVRGELMVVADQTTPYRLLTEVLYSCGQAGYSNYRLLVLKTATSSGRASPLRPSGVRRPSDLGVRQSKRRHDSRRKRRPREA